MIRKVLLACGIASSLLYVASTILGARRWERYSSTSHTVSELSAIGAPSRSLVVPLGLAYDVLVIAFAFGVWGSAGGKRALRVVAGLLGGYGVVGLAGPFVPMHRREALAVGQGSLTDRMHIIVTMVLVLFILLIVGIGATVFGKRFRLYSIGTLLILLVFGALAGKDGPRVAANLPTPWIGLTERVNIFGFLFWVVVLAIGLLRSQRTTVPRNEEQPTAIPREVAR